MADEKKQYPTLIAALDIVSNKPLAIASDGSVTVGDKLEEDPTIVVGKDGKIESGHLPEKKS